MTRHVLALGNTIADHVFRLSEPPRQDGKVHARGFEIFPGGQAANTACAMALLGLSVSFAGVFGDDTGGQLCRAAFEARGIDLSGSRIIAHCPHHFASVWVWGATRSIVMYRDPRLTFDLNQPSLRQVAACDAVYCDGQDIPASLRLARLAKQVAVPVVIDLEDASPAAAMLAAEATHVVAPEEVILALADQVNLTQALQTLLNRGPACVVATRGAEGSVGMDHRSPVPVICPAEPCDVVDTTGAGDAYHAGYVASLMRGADLPERMSLATRVACEKCATAGPQLRRAPLRW